MPRVSETGEVDYSEFKVTSQLDENIQSLKNIFQSDDTVRYRSFENQQLKLKCAIVYIDGMANQQMINLNIIRPIQEWDSPLSGWVGIGDVERQLLTGSEVAAETDFSELVKAALYGDTILFVDGQAQALVIGSKGFSTRGIAEPDSEKALKGPREGFNEAIMTNLSLVRRKLQTTDLKCVFSSLGTRSNTRVCLCYLDSLVDQGVLEDLRARLEKVDMDGVLDANYIIESIQDHRMSPFKTIGSTEKPDTVAARLLEGRIAVFVDGTPMVLTVPYLFIENFQSPDDYYLNFYFASLGRILRIIGFWLTVSVPAIYIALVNYHEEIIPSPMMLAIASATAGVPFPTVMECIGMLILFEILRETGIRSSNKIGQALSIVGGLVVGQAAVEAKIVSAPMVIIVALTGITGMIIPKLNGANIILRFFCIGMAALGGLLGYYAAMLVLLIHLLSLDSFGYPYVRDFFPAKLPYPDDAGVRAPMWDMKDRPTFAADRRRRGGDAP